MLSRTEHVERLMEVDGIDRKRAEARVTRINAARRRGARILKQRAAEQTVIVRTRTRKTEPAAEPAKRRYRPSWTRAGRIYLRRMLIDRNNMAVYRGSDDQLYSQAMLERNVELGSMKIVSRRKTKSGETVTVLARRI